MLPIGFHQQRRTCALLLASLTTFSLAACTPEKEPTPSPPPPAPAVAQCPPPATAQREPDLASLAAKAREKGTVRVIVRLNAQPAQAGLATTQSAAIKAFRDAGAEEVSAISARLPFIIAEVNADELTRMYANPQFAEWSEDRISYPVLAESAALVQAPLLWAQGGRGAGQAVAILDTGVDRTHPFLAGRVVAEACFSTTSLVNGSASVCPSTTSSQTGEGAAAPCSASGCEHGTHVAGIAAGRGQGFSGIAPDADIIAVQVFSAFTGSACRGRSPCVASFTSDQIRALDFVLQQAGQRPVASVNMSLGGGRAFAFCDTDLTKPIIDQLRAAGVAVAIASGNDGYRDSVSFPGCISTAVTVGATSKQNQLAEFSNCGPQVDLHAPGVGIASSIPGERFAAFSGTSMATPHVAGAFAALKSLHPTATVDQIEQALKNTGVDVGGRPLIRLLEASNALAGMTGGPPITSTNPQSPAPEALQTAMADLAALPPQTPVRVIVEPLVAAGQPEATAAGIARIENYARAYGAASVDRLGSQPLVAIECTAGQAMTLATSGLVAKMQIDRAAATQQ